jgi:hypothetical protein
MSSSSKALKEKKSNNLLSPLDLIAQSIALYKANSTTLIGYSAWILLPFVAYIGISFMPNSIPVFTAAFIISILELLLTFWISIVLTKLIFNFDNQKLVKQEVIQKESTLLLRSVVLVALLQLLVVLGGFFLLIIPGLIFIVWYSFSQISAILDNKEGMDALRFSKKLVTGRFWKIAYRLIAGPLLIGIIYALTLGILIMVISIFVGLDPVSSLGSETLPLWIQAFEAVGEILILPLFLTYGVLFYKNAKQTTSLATKKQIS